MNGPTRDTAVGRAYLDLQNLARREHRGTQELLTMYVVERWLARLSCSKYVDDASLQPHENGNPALTGPPHSLVEGLVGLVPC